MKNILLSLSLAAVSSVLSQTAEQMSTRIYFAKDSYTLTEASYHLLDSLRSTIKDPAEELLLIGHTDSDADVAYNKELSLNRTRAVQSYLYDHDVRNRIHIDWKGESKPLNTNKNEAEKTLNRRVEIVRNYKDPNTFTERFSKPSTSYFINPERDTVIVCKEGTRIFVPAGSFRTHGSNLAVELKITEFYKMSDFILNNLSTSTITDELLVSGGTINIEAFTGGEKTELNDLSALHIQFKDRYEGDNMQAYYGFEGASVTKWSTDTPAGTTKMDSILVSKAFKMRNLDTMEIITEQLKNIDGTIYKVVTRQHRNHPTKDFETFVDMEETSQADLVNAILFSPDRSISQKIKPRPQIPDTMPKKFTLASLSLGLLNCDSPIFKILPDFRKDDPTDLEPFIVSRTLEVKVENKETPSISLILDEVNTVIAYTRRENNIYYFDNVPLGQKFEVVAVYADGRGVMMGQLKDKNVPKDPEAALEELTLKMKPCTENDVRLAVQEIDDKRSN